MNIFSRVINGIRNQLGVTLTDPAAREIFGAQSSASGQTVNQRTALQTTAVYACVRVLSETIASLPLQLYKHTSNGKEKAVQHSLYRLLHAEPNPDMTAFVFRETLMSHLLLWGNAYAQIVRNGRGEVLSLYPLLPNRMKVARGKDDGLTYTYQSDNGQVALRQHEVLHIVGLGHDGLIGYSPIDMERNAIGMSMSTEEYGAKFFANDARPSVVLEHPAVLNDPKRLRESWEAAYGGSARSSRVAVLEEGMSLKTISIPPEHAQFLQTRKFQINEIARIFRVPPHMIGDLEKSSFSNIEQQSLEFVKYTLDPWVVRWEQAMMHALLLPSEKKEYFVKFNLEGLLRGDYASRIEGYTKGRQNGWLSANDIREIEDMNRIPAELGGDLYLVNGNMAKLQDAGSAYADKTGGNTVE